MLPSLTIIDDFLTDPWAARRAALALEYARPGSGGNYPGRDSTSALPVEGINASVSRHVGVELTGAKGTEHGHCRITLKSDKGRSGVHIDPAFYSGILYLSRPEDCARAGAGGTDFYRHKRTGLERVPANGAELAATGYDSLDDLVGDVVNKDTTQPSRWERVMRVPMRFNRLVLFSPWQFHNAAPGFGTDAERARLVMLLFFARTRG
ncbi:DUF6445 family protein [Erythrobacter sp.]|uniref:DUF6445 family protein n=1 Tax=Erythrobacter sp. TaxID=1042 RepID=UPI001B2ECF8F|nr:DUF6445 family protein [Erythrobacter sp.]MBO6526029.1 hypothetical protein [Erythrobacter sp.]MBO6531103.1 hypothetical protein [Erythrobacter sp.]